MIKVIIISKNRLKSVHTIEATQKRTITNKLNNNENIEIHFYTTN